MSNIGIYCISVSSMNWEIVLLMVFFVIISYGIYENLMKLKDGKLDIYYDYWI